MRHAASAAKPESSRGRFLLSALSCRPEPPSVRGHVVRGPAVLYSALQLLLLVWLWVCLLGHLHVEWWVNPQYRYGYAVPFLCVYLLWRRVKDGRRHESTAGAQNDQTAGQGRQSALQSSLLGLLFLVLASTWLPTRLIEQANPEWRLVSWALALEVVGLTLLLVQHPSSLVHPCRSSFTFPLLFFLVSVPWPTFVEAPLTQALARANAASAVELLNLFDVPSLQHGNIIEVGAGAVGIDEACSGIRSLQAALMISLLCGERGRLSAARRALLCLLGFVLSFLFNVARTTLLSWVAAAKGTAAIAAWHDPAGVTILVACFLCLWALARWFEHSSPEEEGRKDEALPRCEGDSSHQDRIPPAASPAPAFSLPLYQLALVLCLAWFAAVELATELWYRSHERHLSPAVTWTVTLPTDKANYRPQPFSEKVDQFLRYDEGIRAAWQETDGTQWQAIFLRWKPGRTAANLAASHTPEACLTASGRELLSKSELRYVAVGGLRLPFRFYVFSEDSSPLYVLYCRWEDRAERQSYGTMGLTGVDRLNAVLAGRRNLGQRSLEIAVWGIADAAQAEAALTRQVQSLIGVQE
jgi:exosortase